MKDGWDEEEKCNGDWLMMVWREVGEGVEGEGKGKYMEEVEKEGVKRVVGKEDGGSLLNK